MLNKQGKGKIQTCDYTWNPISGCYHGCDYCYMKRMEKRFAGIMDYKFHKSRLHDPAKLKKPSKIFTGSSGDMWGGWVDYRELVQVLNICAENNQHAYQFLTKNPDNYEIFDFSDRNEIWLGTSVDGTEFTKKNLEILQSISCQTRFVSFEPLLKPVYPDLSGIDWVIIGANSNRGSVKPPDEWADNIINVASKVNCAVFVKDNYGYREEIKYFPNNS